MTIQISKSIVDTFKPFRNEMLNKPETGMRTQHKKYICDEEPNITQDKLVKLTSIPRRTLQRIMSDLQGKGMLVREGGKRFGYWKHVK